MCCAAHWLAEDVYKRQQLVNGKLVIHAVFNEKIFFLHKVWILSDLGKPFIVGICACVEAVSYTHLRYSRLRRERAGSPEGKKQAFIL